MPHGFFTIEQWKPPRRGRTAQWVGVAHVDASGSLTAALAEIERRNRAGLFRVIQTQRQVWAERVNGKLTLRKWHASSPRALERTMSAFARDKGRFNAKG